MKKTIILTIVFLLNVVFLYAQCSVEYSYDYAGNRTERQVICLGTTRSAEEFIEEDLDVDDRNIQPSEPVMSLMDNLNIRITPNPTRGLIGVEIEGACETDVLMLTVCSIGGKLLQTEVLKLGINPIDLSGYANGHYILQINSGNSRKEFKLIKY